MATSTCCWAWLPELALNLILHKLPCLPDCVRFASVCASWRLAARNAGNKQFSVPMLLQIPIIKRKSSHGIVTTRQRLLYSVQEKKTYDIQLPYLNSETTSRLCGSTHGWLIKLERDLSITLYSPTKKNPQRTTIHLPPVTNINNLCSGLSLKYQQRIQEIIHFDPQSCARKVILSANPTATRDYVVVAIYGFWKQLAILRSGDDGNWTYLDKSLGSFSDATRHKNKLYAVTERGILMRIDGVTSKNLSPSMVYSTKYSPEKYVMLQFYLVESSRGELLLVERYFNPKKRDQNCCLITSGFKVHRLEMSPIEEEKKLPRPKVWPALHLLLMRVPEKANRVEVNEIGGDALFLGDNYSMAVAASEMSQCRGNCIYHTKESVANEMGIFCLENGKFETLYHPNPPQGILYPIWFTPILSDWI